MDYNKFEEMMKKAITHLEEEFSEVRAGRANPTILNKISVEYYGTLTPINQVAGISVPEAKLIVIQPWDQSIVKTIEKAIIEANFGINPQSDGKVIRLAFPDLTEERRKELAKEIKEIAEETKVRIRNVRREANDFFKKEEKDKNISEDDLKRSEDEIQKLTDKYNKLIDEKLDVKQKEIMTI